MNTDRLMQLALEMAGLGEAPGDSAIHHPGDGIERILFGIDLKAPELAIASAQEFDAAISHHPVGGSSTLRFHEVLESGTSIRWSVPVCLRRSPRRRCGQRSGIGGS